MNTTKYMNVETGHVGEYEDWYYRNDNGNVTNAVDTGEVVEVVKDENGDWIEA